MAVGFHPLLALVLVDLGLTTLFEGAHGVCGGRIVYKAGESESLKVEKSPWGERVREPVCSGDTR